MTPRNGEVMLMKRPQIPSCGGLLGIITVLLALSMTQGCSISGSEISNSSLVSQPNPMKSDSRRTPSSEAPASVYTGSASWYGPGFHGKKTASGEVFDQTKFTAAHKTIPLGRRARVTHLANGKSIEVLINDRGPYVAGRLIDLSQAAAEALGLINNGVAKVQVELLDETSVPKM